MTKLATAGAGAVTKLATAQAGEVAKLATAAAGAMTEPSGVGEALAQARQAQGLALADVALQLKFAARQLEALEQERFDRLPGGTFARGMVRSYARLLKLDPEPLLKRIAGRFDLPDSSELAARFSQPVPFSNGGRHSTIVYLAISLAVLVLVGLAAYEWRQEPARVRLAAPVPQDGASAAPAPPPAPAPAPAPEAAAPVPPGLLQAAAEVREAPSAKEPAETPQDAAAAAAPGAGRIVLRFEEESWIEIKDSADRLLASSLNPAGSLRVVQGRPPFTLVIGNAQHVRLRYNDQPVDLHPHIKVEVARLTLK